MNANETLLWQNRLLLKGKFKSADKIDFTNQLLAGIAQGQVPNTAMFGLDLETANIGYIMPRTKLSNYNLFYKKFAVRNDSTFYKNNIIQLPVIFDSNKVASSLRLLKIICANNGFFYPTIYDSIVYKKHKKTSVYYIVKPNKNFILNSVTYETNNKEIDSILTANRNNTYTKWNVPLSLTDINNERMRLSTILLENGYFNLRPSVISPEIDTSAQKLMENFNDQYALYLTQIDTSYTNKPQEANLKFLFSDSINNEKVRKFYIGTIEVEIQENNKPAPKILKQEYYDGIYFRNFENNLNPKVISQNIFIHKNDVFNSAKIDATINRLKSLNALQNVKIDLKAMPDSNIVNCVISLAMNTNYESQFEIESSNGTGYDIGAGAKIGVKVNNVFNKAYLWNIGLQGGVQGYFVKNKIQLWQNNLGINTDLKIPHFLIPNFLNWNKPEKTPSTILGLSYNYYNRPVYFLQTTANGQITYTWDQNKRIKWKVSPASLTFVKTPYISDSTRKTFITNPLFEQQLKPYTILSSIVNFEYSNKKQEFQYNNTYLRVNFEKAGAILDAVANDNGASNIAKYSKVETELKHYINSKTNSWVNRIYIYAGIPAKDKALPFIKQQSIGGPVSLRGWRVYELGPGPIRDTTNNSRNLLKNIGDIKIEMNSEVRQSLGKLFSGAMRVEGALFVDAGNIWRYKDTTNNGISQFSFAKIPKDIAINTGIGFRFDFTLFLFRIDYGIPIKQPNISENGGWVLKNDTNFKQFGTRRYGTWQFGINYPF